MEGSGPLACWWMQAAGERLGYAKSGNRLGVGSRYAEDRALGS